MSAEFNASGFDAVASFFGDTVETNEVQVKQNDHKKSSFNKKRLGVGMKAKNDDTDISAVESIAAKEKILAIGKKRKYDEDSDNADHGTDESSDDEGGRTSVVKEKSAQTNHYTAVNVEMKKKKTKKKKKGKKERFAEKFDESESCNPQPNSDENLQIAEDDLESEDAIGDTSDAAYQKKKRRKTRSKQKNVRKDARSSQDKPEHLRIGSKSYAGRALTQETRIRLSLPESRTSQIRKERATGKVHASSEDHSSVPHLGLAVDDLLSDNVDGENDKIVDSGELIKNGDTETDQTGNSPPRNKIPKQKRKKKSKFKNLK